MGDRALRRGHPSQGGLILNANTESNLDAYQQREHSDILGYYIRKMNSPYQDWLTLDEEARQQARQFHYFYCLVSIFATPRAVYWYLLLNICSPAGIAYLRGMQMTPWKIVRDINTVRLVRKLLNFTGWAASPAIVWPETVPSSCVIAFFHSNWDKFMARENANRRCCLIRAQKKQKKRLGTQFVALEKPLRRLVRSVIKGSRCGVAIDTSVKAVNVPIADTSIELGTTPFRIAVLTGTPLVPIWSVYESGVLRIIAGKPIDVPKSDVGYEVALSFAGKFFENAIQIDPASWRKIFPFLMHLNNV